MALTRITKGVIKPNENYDTHNINSTGIVTAIGFKGPFTGSSDIQSGIITATKIDLNGDIDVDGHTNLDNVSIAGVVTATTINATTFAGAISGTTGTFSGNVSIGGTLTYEDVTNIDSVGLVTARDGIRVTSGKVGINETNPRHHLTVNSGTTNVAIAVSSTDTGSFIAYQDNTTGDTGTNSEVYAGATGGSFVIHTDAQSRPRITVNNSGQVGICTDDIPSDAAVHIGLTGAREYLRLDADNGGTNAYIELQANNNRRKAIIFKSGGTRRACLGVGDSDEGNATKLFLSANDSLGGNNAHMIIESGGQIGIKHQTPSTQYFNNLVVGDDSAGDRGITIRTSSSNKGVLAFSDTDSPNANRYDGWIGYLHQDQRMVFNTGGANHRMSIDKFGRVGIGLTNPDTLLELSNAVSGTGNLLKLTSTTNSQSSRPGIVFWNNNPNTAQAQISAKGGASYNASKLHFAVANTSRALQDRACIDEYGTFIIGPGEVRRNTKGSNQHQAFLIEGTGNNSSRMSMIRSSNDDNGPEIQLIKTRGTSVGSVTKPNNGDYIGSLTFIAGDDSDLYARSAEISVQAQGVPANDTCPGDIIFSVTNIGANAPTERLRIGAAGITTSNASIYFPDSKMAIFGNSSDLQIWHDGNSRISDRGGAGNLQIESNNAILMQTNDSTNAMAKFFPTGNYQNEFYNDNDWNQAKLRTTDHGIDIFHNGDFGLSFSDDIGEIGDVAGFQAVNKALSANTAFGIRATDIRFATGSSEKVRIDSSGNVVFSNTSTEIKTNTSDGSDNKRIILAAGGDNSQSRGAQIAMYGNEYSSNEGRLQLLAGNSGNSNGIIQMYAGGSEKVRIDSSGRLRVGNKTESADSAFDDLIVGGHSGNVGISILGVNGQQSALGFAKAGVLSDAYIAYNHNSTQTSSNMIIKSGGKIQLYHKGAERFYTTDSGVVVESTGNTPTIHWLGASNNEIGKIDSDAVNGTTSQMRFYTEYSGGLTEQMHLHAGGEVYIRDELRIDRTNNNASGFTKGGQVLNLPGYKEYHYTWSGQSSYTIDLTCASYFHAEFIYTQAQTNGGVYMQYYARGKWANNHTTHTGVMWEWHGDGGGLDVQFTVSDQSGNGAVNMRNNLSGNGATGTGYVNGGGEGQNTGSANGRLRIAETYNWGSVSARSLIVKVYYGSFSISKS